MNDNLAMLSKMMIQVVSIAVYVELLTTLLLSFSLSFIAHTYTRASKRTHTLTSPPAACKIMTIQTDSL